MLRNGDGFAGKFFIGFVEFMLEEIFIEDNNFGGFGYAKTDQIYCQERNKIRKNTKPISYL